MEGINQLYNLKAHLVQMWEWLVGCEVFIRSTYVHPQCFFLLNRCAVLSTIVCLFCYFFFWSLCYLSFDLWIPIIAINTIHHLQTHYTILAIRSHHPPYMYSILLLKYYSPVFPLVILVILTITVNYHWLYYFGYYSQILLVPIGFIGRKISVDFHSVPLIALFRWNKSRN